MKLSLTLILSCFIGLVFGQAVKSEDITYTYVKLPTNPLQPKVDNYYSTITSSSEAANAKLMAEFEADKARAEADYQRELADYPAKVKAADDKFAKEMEVYNAKSTATKVIEKQLLNENTKPVKDYVAQPYRRTISQPVLKSSYDYPSLAATYLVLDGFTKAQVNALSYSVNIEGYENSQPTIKSEEKDEVSVKDGVRTTYKVRYYWIEFTYRMPMSVRIAGMNNQEIFYVAPAELSAFKTYKSSSSKTQPSPDFSMLVKSTEENLLKENLKFINHLVNDRIGYEVTTRATSLDYVKSKNDAHADVMEAYNNATIGLKTLTTNEALAKQKLTAAIDAFKVILTESDVYDKKARIDKDVTVAVYFDLIECYFAMRNTVDAEAALKSVGQLDLSNRDKKQKEKMDELFLDLTLRKAANGL
jgi:hypothetical protein